MKSVTHFFVPWLLRLRRVAEQAGDAAGAQSKNGFEASCLDLMHREVLCTFATLRRDGQSA